MIEKIELVKNQLNEIDNYFDDLPNLQRDIDYKISDILHFLQKEDKLNLKQAYNLMKILKQLRIERMKLQQDNRLKNTYESNKNKFILSQHRDFVMNELYKSIKNEDYNYREYDEEMIREMI